MPSIVLQYGCLSFVLWHGDNRTSQGHERKIGGHHRGSHGGPHGASWGPWGPGRPVGGGPRPARLAGPAGRLGKPSRSPTISSVLGSDSTNVRLLFQFYKVEFRRQLCQHYRRCAQLIHFTTWHVDMAILQSAVWPAVQGNQFCIPCMGAGAFLRLLV